MNFPIVQVKTTDGLTLSGLLVNEHHRKIVLHVHGTGGSFYYNQHFLKPLAEELNKINVGLLSVNTRGADIFEPWVNCKTVGAAAERFEDCIVDIDAWIEYATQKGYEVILSGHSLGTEKLVYYLNTSKYKHIPLAVLLLGFADSVGSNELYAKDRLTSYLAEAKDMIDSGKEGKLLSDPYVHAGCLPQTAESYWSFFGPESALKNALPLRNGSKLELYKTIEKPILGVIGDHGEWTVIPITDAIELMRNENIHAEIVQIQDCDHEYNNKEVEVAKIIAGFLSKTL